MEVSPLLANDTSGSIEAASRIHRAGGSAEPLRQDPGHARRHPGDRRVDPRRRADQRDAAVLVRAVPRRGRSLPPRHRAPRRRGPRSAGRFGRLPVREPLGQGGQRKGAGRAAQPARHRHRRVAPTAPIAGCWRRRAGAPWQLPAHVPSVCSGPARGPRTPGPRRRCTSKPWRRPIPSTRCPRRPCTPSPSRARSTA